ncbi:MAG: DNA polymerase III subunit delta [Phycisphaerae bacterium]
MTQAPPELSPVYAVFGDDAFLMRQAVDSVVARAFGEGTAAMGPTRIDGDTAELADVLDELQTLSLLGDMRMVIVEGGDDFITRYRKQLETYCAKPAGDACLILLCRSMPKNTRLYKAIAKGGRVVECKSPKGQQVVTWMMKRCKDAHGKTLERPAALRLRELVGNGLEGLDNELAKLSMYVGQRPAISAEDVDALVGRHREEVIFRVTDAMSAGDMTGALRAWEQVLATDRAAPMRAIAALASAIRRLLQAKQAIDAGESPQAWAPQFGPNRQAFMDRIGAASADRLKQQLMDLHAADLESKTGLTQVDIAIEAFVVKHTARSRRRA